jgi:uncharacterized protein YwgA
MLIGAGSSSPREGLVGGITRLQKLLFLLENEEGLRPDGEGFAFSAYKAGPYSSKLYDDIELLQNLRLLESESMAVATEAEAADIDALTFDELMGPPGELAADNYEERRFRLTEQGRAKVEALLQEQRLQPVAEKIERVKQRYGKRSLDDLLYYVYTKYPEMTVESEIKDHVLGRRRR